MITLILLVLLAASVEIIYSPRLDFTRNEHLLLWYGKINRKFVIIW